MAKPENLIQVMTSEEKAWKPSDLCAALGVSIVELQRLIKKSESQGLRIEQVKHELVGNSFRLMLVA